ncbi:MAG: hypothetical protein WCI50_04345 [Actinomycetes bacterium]
MRALSLAVVGVVVALLLAGCGGGTTAPGSGPRLTRAEMVTRAEAACAKGFAASEALRQAADPTAHGAAAATEIDATLGVLVDQVRGLARLRGPVDTDVTLARTLRALRSAAAGVRRLRGAVVRGDLTVNEALRAEPALVRRTNAASGSAQDGLVRLGFLGCVAASGDG